MRRERKSQEHHEKPVAQYAGDISIFEKNGISFSPLSLIAMHGARSIGTNLGSDKKACDIAELLLKNGADIDVLDSGDMGNTPLHWALVTFKDNLCKLFIQHALDHQIKLINTLINLRELTLEVTLP